MYKNIKDFLKTNILFFVFFLGSIINGIVLRGLTVWNIFSIQPLMADIVVILVIASFAYLMKFKNQERYLIILSILTTLICISNSIYYAFYMSFSSISLIAYSHEVIDAISQNSIRLTHFVYIWFPVLLIFLNIYLKRKGYYKKNKQVGKRKKSMTNILLSSLVFLSIFILLLTPLDINRISKEWNREYVLSKFGVYTYQINDIVKSLQPKVNSLLWRDKALAELRKYYSQKEEKDIINKYTNIYEGKNIIVLHVESLQTFVMDLEFNEIEVTPNINNLAENGLFFSNFYAQTSAGTSSDSEFTLNTSLMPSSNGTAFVNYADREYVTIPSLLKEKGYYSFGMHANDENFWNRKVMYETLGYNKFYSKEDYNEDETIGLGLSDASFLDQSVDKIKQEVEDGNLPFYATLVTLTSHTPFDQLEEYGEFDVDIKTDDKTLAYMEDTKLGNYLKAIHYTDNAIGEFIDRLDEENLLEDTVIIIYGDHDARLAKRDYELLYNYDKETGEMLTIEDEDYEEVDFYSYELNKKVPLIVYTKDETKKEEIETVMGMYDVLPTLGNMFNFESYYTLGYDIMNLEDNKVVLANGSFITNKVYYNSPKGEYLVLEENPLEEDYIEKHLEYSNNLIEMSNKILLYDLVKYKRIAEQIINEYTK